MIRVILVYQYIIFAQMSYRSMQYISEMAEHIISHNAAFG